MIRFTSYEMTNGSRMQVDWEKQQGSVVRGRDQ